MIRSGAAPEARYVSRSSASRGRSGGHWSRSGSRPYSSSILRTRPRWKGLPGMARGGQRQPLPREVQARPQDARRLHRLVRGAREDRRRHLPQRQLHGTVGAQYDQAAPVPPLDETRTGRPRRGRAVGPERTDVARAGHGCAVGGGSGCDADIGGGLPDGRPACGDGPGSPGTGGRLRKPPSCHTSRSSTCASPHGTGVRSPRCSRRPYAAAAAADGRPAVRSARAGPFRRSARRRCGPSGRTARPRRASPRPAAGTPRSAACRASHAARRNAAGPARRSGSPTAARPRTPSPPVVTTDAGRRRAAPHAECRYGPAAAAVRSSRSASSRCASRLQRAQPGRLNAIRSCPGGSAGSPGCPCAARAAGGASRPPGYVNATVPSGCPVLGVLMCLYRPSPRPASGEHRATPSGRYVTECPRSAPIGPRWGLGSRKNPGTGPCAHTLGAHGIMTGCVQWYSGWTARTSS